MARRKQKEFYLVIVDRSKKQFNIEGPMTDDTAWNGLVINEKNKGREINCFSVGVEGGKERVANSYASQYGYVYISERLI